MNEKIKLFKTKRTALQEQLKDVEREEVHNYETTAQLELAIRIYTEVIELLEKPL